MTRQAALPISLYLRDRDVTVISPDWSERGSAARRAGQLTAAGARVRAVDWSDYSPAVCEGARLVAAQFHGAPPAAPPTVEEIAADARAAGALVYVADMPDLSDLAMPGVATRGPVKLAISTDAVAPALTRRLREQLQLLLDGAGDAFDALVRELETARATPPGEGRPARLNAIASRLRVRGAIEIDPA